MKAVLTIKMNYENTDDCYILMDSDRQQEDTTTKTATAEDNLSVKPFGLKTNLKKRKFIFSLTVILFNW